MYNHTALASQRSGFEFCSGALFSKVPKTFRARKAIRKTPARLFCKAGLYIYVVKGIKIEITAKFRGWRRLRFEDTKRNAPEKFRDFRETGLRAEVHK